MNGPEHFMDVLTRLGPVFTAAYESDCEGCAVPILPGDACRADGSGGWVHATEQCQNALTGTPVQLPRPACATCFQVPANNGSCGCF